MKLVTMRIYHSYFGESKSHQKGVQSNIALKRSASDWAFSTVLAKKSIDLNMLDPCDHISNGHE